MAFFKCLKEREGVRKISGLNDMKISTKAMIFVATVLMCVIGVGILCSYSNDKSNTALTKIYEENFKPVQIINDEVTQSSVNYFDLFRLVEAENLSEQQAILADIKQRKANFNNDLADYSKIPRDQYEEKQYKLIKEKLTVWNMSSDKIIKLTLSGKTKEASNILNQAGAKALKELQAGLQNLNNYRLDFLL